MSVRSFLVTGPDAALDLFHLAVCLALNGLDRRGQTCRYACLEEDAPLARRAAEGAGVTLQEIVTVGRENVRTLDLGGGCRVEASDNVEEYPVFYLAPHGMKWERGAKNSRRKGG